MNDMRLVSIWRAIRSQNCYVGFHSHKYHELVYYRTGKGKTQMGDEKYSFRDGCFAVISPFVEHDELHDADSDVICLEFSCAQGLPTGFHKDISTDIYKTLKELLNEAKKQNYGYREMINLKLNELVLYILRGQNNTADEKNFEYIINYLCENFHERIILSDCAAQLNISYDYFQHKFKKITGLSPQQFLVNQRLSASQDMLRAKNLSCTEIAYRCGFSTSAQFSALFKRQYGITPLQFQKNKT